MWALGWAQDRVRRLNGKQWQVNDPLFYEKKLLFLAIEKREHMGIKNTSDSEVSWLLSEKFENLVSRQNQPTFAKGR